MKLFIVAIFWSVGILVGSILQISVPMLILLMLIPSVLFLLALRNHKLLIYAIYALALFLGIARMQALEKAVNEDSLIYHQGKEQSSVQGVLDSEITGKGRVIRFEVSVTRIEIDGTWKEVKGRALVEALRGLEYKYGDLLYLKGVIRPLAESDEYYHYLEKQGVSSWMSFPRITLIESNGGLRLKQKIHNLRTKLSYSLSSYLPEPQGALAQALLLGLRQEIPGELNRDFRNTGTTHLLAISGMNISIFAGMVMSLGLWLFGRRHYLYLVFAFLLVWLYTFLSGMNPPVMRAAFMASAYFLAEFIGRPHSAAPVLALSAIIMTAIDPAVLREVSFQLSFMAMLGLTFITPLFMKLRANIFQTSAGFPDMHGFPGTVWDMAAVSVGAILATLPLTAYYFNVIPLAGLPATVFASLTLPHIIIMSSLTSISGLIFTPLAQLLGWVDWVFLTYMILAVKAFSFWPYIALEASFPLPLLGSYYVMLMAVTTYFADRQRAKETLSNLSRRLNLLLKSLPVPGTGFRNVLLPGLLLANILIWAALFSLPDRFTHVYFLDVGHGDSVFVQTPGGHQILIDGGPELYKARLYLGKKMPFWDRQLDMVVLTHPHEDHLGGLPQVLRKYKVDYILDSRIPVKTLSYDRWLQQVKAEGAKDILARDGTLIDLGHNTSLEVLHPPLELENRANIIDVDNNAMAFRLAVGNISFLLPSDNRDKSQREIVFKHPDLWTTVLAAPHHGGTSLDPLFTSATRPSSIIVSASFKDPASREKAISRIREKFPHSSILTTSEHGAIEFITDGEKLWVRMER